MGISELLDRLEATRAETLRRFASLDPARLEDERQWRGAPSQLRFLLNWLSEGAESRRLRMIHALSQLNRPLTQAQQAVLMLAIARGRLRGEIVGLPDDVYDRDPAEGEWSVRRVLGHVIATDERYRLAVEYAIGRARAGGTGPMRPPEASLPARTGEAQSGGTPEELRLRLWDERRRVVETLVAIPDDLLTAPTNWTVWDLDVRFRIHRFAAHDREHTIQIRKALQALRVHPTEPQMLLADAMVELEALEALLVCAGDAALDAAPPDGGPAIRALIEEAMAEERALDA